MIYCWACSPSGGWMTCLGMSWRSCWVQSWYRWAWWAWVSWLACWAHLGRAWHGWACWVGSWYGWACVGRAWHGRACWACLGRAWYGGACWVGGGWPRAEPCPRSNSRPPTLIPATGDLIVVPLYLYRPYHQQFPQPLPAFSTQGTCQEAGLVGDQGGGVELLLRVKKLTLLRG